MKNSPKLRFPEFVNNGEWEEQELGKLGKFLGGGTPSKSVDEYWHGTIPWISSSDINEDDLKTISITRFINEKSVLESATKIVPKESVLFVSRVGTGKLAINSIDLCTSQDFTNFIPIQIYNYFLGYYFLANKSALTSLDQGTSIKGFSKSDLEKFKLTYPKKKEEQQKITDCLSSVDSLIFAQSKKVELLKEHKKGLMQQLFPQDGEEVPKLRFPEFVNGVKWEEEKLSEIYTFKVTNSFSRDKLNYDSGLVKNIHYGDIHTKFSTLFDIEKENVPFINSSISLEKTKDDCYCQESDMIFADASEDLEDVGKSIEIVNLNNEKLLSGLHTLQARQKESKFITGFGGYLFKSNKIRAQIKKESQGTKVLSISGTRLSNIDISYPKKKEEQQKIADCLNSVDEQISSQSQKLQTLKEHKKALMQQLFPHNKEITNE